MTDLFEPTEFDAWAANYDKEVGGDGGFPFDGYSRLLQTILELASPQPGAAVLDLGIGTGNLALRFAGLECEIWGLDFSGEMLALAKGKIPGAVLGKADLRIPGWPPAFRRRFDCIVSAYTFHHFLLEEKVRLVQRLIDEHLLPGGRLLIGDIAFRDAAEEDALRRSMGTDWEQEYYWLADEALAAFALVGVPGRFSKISACAGIFQFGIDQ
jgi:putative AdoMet-dependent methyltransferase